MILLPHHHHHYQILLSPQIPLMGEQNQVTRAGLDPQVGVILDDVSIDHIMDLLDPSSCTLMQLDID